MLRIIDSNNSGFIVEIDDITFIIPDVRSIVRFADKFNLTIVMARGMPHIYNLYALCAAFGVKVTREK